MSDNIEHDPNFPSWEAEKAWKVKRLGEIGNSIQEMGSFLQQFGISGNTVHGKINAICDMLIEAGVITEKQLLDMEFQFASDTENEMKEACAEIRQQAALSGRRIPQGKQSGLIIPGR